MPVKDRKSADLRIKDVRHFIDGYYVLRAPRFEAPSLYHLTWGVHAISRDRSAMCVPQQLCIL